MAPVREQRLAGVVEVDVGVVALPHLLDREVEDLRWEAPLPRLEGHLQADSRRRHSARAAFATSSCSGEGSAVTSRCCSSWPGRASARANGWRSLATIQEKTSTAAATEPTPAASRASGPQVRGARGRARCRPRSWRAAGRSCGSRSARARACAARRARSSRSRCARRRGTRRAPCRGARRPRARARAARPATPA